MAKELEKIFKEFAEPWSDKQLKFRIQRVDRRNDPPRWAQVAAYVDARDVIERFNTVCAKYGATWASDFEVLERRIVGKDRDGNDIVEVVVRGTVRLEFGDHTFTHSDAGIGGDEKAAVSDALKRVAVRYGMDGAYRGHEVWLGQGEFTGQRINVDHAVLLERFKTGAKPASEDGQTSGGQRGCKDPNAPASTRAQGFAHGLMKRAGVQSKEHRAILASLITGGEKVDLENMTCQQASDIIEALNGEDKQLWLDKLNEVLQEEGRAEEEFPEELPF